LSNAAEATTGGGLEEEEEDNGGGAGRMIARETTDPVCPSKLFSSSPVWTFHTFMEREKGETESAKHFYQLDEALALTVRSADPEMSKSPASLTA